MVAADAVFIPATFMTSYLHNILTSWQILEHVLYDPPQILTRDWSINGRHHKINIHHYTVPVSCDNSGDSMLLNEFPFLLALALSLLASNLECDKWKESIWIRVLMKFLCTWSLARYRDSEFILPQFPKHKSQMKFQIKTGCNLRWDRSVIRSKLIIVIFMEIHKTIINVSWNYTFIYILS